MADETPGQYLSIPESLGRDIDAGKTPPIEAFMSDSTLQALKDQQQDTVHAEDLVPISKADAAQRTRFDGENLPSFPATRRVIPAPFRRDRVVGGKHGKKWQPVKGSQIRRGDIITGIGLVVDVESKTRYAKIADHLLEGMDEALGDQVAIGTYYLVTGAGGNEAVYEAQTPVRVFR